MFEYNNGVHLKDSTIWFDATRKKKLSFVSSALSTKYLRHEKVITTPQTLKLLQSKFSNVDVLPCPYNHIFNLGEIEVELLPSGYILGSCQVLLYKKNIKILYVSDFKLDIPNTCFPLEITECDKLVIKSDFGLKDYIFPSIEIAIKPIIEFINESLEIDLIPVIVADGLGNSQELINSLGNERYNLYVHDSIHKINKIYEDYGFSLPRYKRLNNSEKIVSGVVIVPDEYRTDRKLSTIKNTVYASVSEVDVKNGILKSDFNDKNVFPFCVRSGYDEMVKFVEIVNPKEIYVTGDHNFEFCSDLKKRGYNASALNNPKQLNLI